MKVRIDTIHIGNRKRKIGDIGDLVESISQVGLLQPIVVTQDMKLVAGHRRLEACKQLNWQTIEATVVTLDDLNAELAEIDENLIRAELTVLERAEHLARRKEIYEALHPETRHGGAPGKPGGGKVARAKDETVSSFADDTAAKTGLSPRTVQHDVQIATRLAQDVKEAIRETPIADSKRTLLELARQTPEEQRKTVAQIIVSSESNEWYTPARYVDAAREVLGGIDVDPASCELANKTIKASIYYTAENDGLAHDWPGRVWLNPPYGGLTAKFVTKLVEQYKSGITKAAILLVNAHATDTAWFQPLWDYTLCFTDHRINFESPALKTNGSTHGSVFVYFGPEPVKFARVFKQFGAIVRRWEP